MSRILVVDDNVKNVRLLTGMLQFKGFQVESALSGTDGVEQALTSPPDLILMDVQMPGISGTEAMKKLKQDVRTETTPILAVTALAMTGDAEELLREGFDGYISKPIALQTLIATVKEFLNPPDARGGG